MALNKNLCEVHRLYYSGTNCPLCEQERINSLVKKYYPKDKTKEEPREATESDIARLIEKFNNR